MDLGIVAMASWGDVIISTIIPKVYKDQRPDTKITFYTSSACAGALLNNPSIDNLVVIPASKDHSWAIQDSIIADARKKHEKVITPWAGFTPQCDWIPLNRPGWDYEFHPNFMWATVRTAQSEGLAVPNPPVIYLYPWPEEIENANKFVASLNNGRRKVIMEVEGQSGQSWMRQSWIDPIMTVFMEKWKDVDLLISKGGDESPEIAAAKAKWPGRVHLMNKLSLREVSVVFNSCDAFIGCSSGTGNACHTHLCKKNILWFETVKDRLWDSWPLRPYGKFYHRSEDPQTFFDLIRNNVK